MFAKVLEQGKTATAPVKDAIKHHWREILLSAGVRFAEQMPFYLFTTFVLTYVVQVHHYSKTFILRRSLVGAAVELAAIPFFSHLSDSLGRRKVYTAGAVIAGVFAFPYFYVLTHGSAVSIFIVIVLSMIVHSMMYGPQAALIGESFPRTCVTAAPASATNWHRCSRADRRRWWRRGCFTRRERRIRSRSTSSSPRSSRSSVALPWPTVRVWTSTTRRSTAAPEYLSR